MNQGRYHCTELYENKNSSRSSWEVLQKEKNSNSVPNKPPVCCRYCSAADWGEYNGIGELYWRCFTSLWSPNGCAETLKPGIPIAFWNLPANMLYNFLHLLYKWHGFYSLAGSKLSLKAKSEWLLAAHLRASSNDFWQRFEAKSKIFYAT